MIPRLIRDPLRKICSATFVAVLALLSLNSASFAADEEDKARKRVTAQSERDVEVVADDLQYIKAEQKIVARGNVVVVHEGVELSADEAEVKVDTKEAAAKGHVYVRHSQMGVLGGNQAFYNFETSDGSFPNGRFFRFPWYGRGEELTSESGNIIRTKNVSITSCDLSSAHYDVQASSATVYPGDKIIARNVKFRILGVPVFWWPYLVIPLDHSVGGLSPGYSDDWGAYIKTVKGIAVTENIKGRLLADWYSKRGFGVGADLTYKFDRLGVGEFKIYGIFDDDAPNQKADNPFAEEERGDKDRGRLSWRHKMRLDPYTTAQVQWHELSDDRFLQDFFESEHREEIDPQSFATITRSSDKYSLLAHLEKRTNRFQSVDEKIPEIIFTWLRKPLFGTNFYYANEEGFLSLRKTQAFGPKLRQTLQMFTDHELSYPMRFFRFYNFNPFINFREDVYTEGRTKEEKISRYAMGLGFDASTRFYGHWDYEGEFLGIKLKEVRHVVEPIIQYNAIKLASVEPTRLISTGRGDDIDHQDVVTFGVENRIQTKQEVEGEVSRVDLVSFNTFLDLSFGPGSDLLETTANKFTEARVETILRPYSWLQMRDEFAYSFRGRKFSRNNLDLVFKKGPLDLIISHRLENGSSASQDSQLMVDTTYTLNERWDIGAHIRWEAFDNLIEEWEIRATRDLHDFILDFGFNVRDSDRNESGEKTNKEFFVELQLKALEEINLKTGHRASFSAPRIGRTVAGSNEAPPPTFLPPTGGGNVNLTTG